jgi:hypothetical protein
MDYETAVKVVSWHNRNKPTLITADGRIRKVDEPHFSARVLRSWEME